METQEIIQSDLVTVVTVEVLTDLLDVFYKKLDKAQKAYRTLGQELEIISTREFSRWESVDVIPGLPEILFKTERHYTEFTIRRPAINVREGVTYIGTISLDAGVKMVYRHEDCPEDIVLHEIPLKCDHCETNRRRKKYFVFIEDGTVKTIGSKCCQLYFGLDVEKMLSVWEKSGSIIEDKDGYDYESWPANVFSLDSLILATEYICAKGKWIPKNATEFGRGSTHVIQDLLYDCRLRRNEEYTKLFRAFLSNAPADHVQKVREMLKSKYSGQPTCDFQWNIRNALYHEDGEGNLHLRDCIPVKCSGIAAFAVFQCLFGDYKRYADREKEKEQEKEQQPELTPGDKITLEVTVTDSRIIEGRYGLFVLIGFDDAHGNQYRWFSTGGNHSMVEREWRERIEAGTPVKITGTFKKTGEYCGKPQIHLTRVKVTG